MGYSVISSLADIYYNDPHYDDDYYGKYDTKISEIEKAIKDNAGYFIRSK